jgi:hypothetical protein
LAINDDQVAFLDYFCDDTHNFDYAVLIDAPWGSGKTYFLKDYLKRKYPVPTTASPEPPEYLWVSLFGRTNTSEVRDALFAEAHPWLSSKWGALVGSVGSGLLRKVSGVDVADNALTKRFLPEIKAKLIVFDDLERTTIGPANALGLINSFVESGTFKVIVIANQKAFGEDKDYRSQKEKVIGRTLTVMSDPDAVLSELTKILQDGRARDALTANRDDVLAVFRASNYHNLRSLRAALDDFDRLVAKSDPRLAATPVALRELLLYLVAIGMEVRADVIQGEKLEEILGAARMLSFATRKDPTLAEARGLTSKYPSISWQNPIISPGILGRLITGGVLPLQEINNGLAVHPLIVGAKEVPAWLSLWNWMQLNATDYAASRGALLDQLASHSIVHPGEILHVVGTIIRLDEFGDKLVPDIETYFLAYIDELLNGGTLVQEQAVFDTFYSDGWASHGYQENDHPTFKEVLAHLQEAVRSAHRRDMVEEAKKLLQRLHTPGSERDLYEFDRKSGRFGGVALLQNISIADFADILVKDSLYDSQLIAALHRRYDLGRGSPELIEEKSWLVELEAEVKRRAAVAPAPFSSLLARRSEYWFDDIRKNMEAIEALAAANGNVPHQANLASKPA